MTLVEKRRGPQPATTAADSSGRSEGHTAWLVISALAVAAVVGSIWVARTGLVGDARGNPEVTTAVRESPLFGVDNWPAVFSSIFVVVALGLGVAFAWLSYRQRSMHHGLVVFLCVTGLSLLDPPANWVTFTVFDPQFLHFPTTWHWMSLTPLVEPIVNVPGYPMYFLTIALTAGWAAKQVLRRAKPGSWTARHPRGTYLWVGFLAGLVWDIPTELLMIRAHMYHYSEAWGPTIGVGHGRFPIVWGFFTWFAIATVTVLLHRDDRGQSLGHDLARRLPGHKATSLRVVAAGTLFLWVLYCVPMGLYAVIRVTGLSHPNLPSGWQYPESKVYDPYGRLAEHGIPGPYFK